MSNYLLSDGDLNDTIGYAIQDDVITAITPYHDLITNPVKEGGKYTYNNINKFGLFSDLLKGIPVLAYDHPGVLEKFPNGMVTENAIFLPASLYEHIGGLKEDEGKYFYKNDNLSALAFIEYLTQMLDQRFEKNFSDDLTNIVKQCLDSRLYSNYVENNLEIYQSFTHSSKPPFVSNEDLANLCESLNISTANVIRAWGNDTSFIDNVLINSKEVNDASHPFSTLKELINAKPLDTVSPNISFEEFHQLYGNGLSPTNVPKAIKVLEDINQNLLKDYPDINDYTTKLNEKYIPFLLSLNDKDFALALESFKNEFGKYHTGKDDCSILSKDIAQNINSYTSDECPGITTNKRDILIASISSFNNIYFDRANPFSNSKHMVLEKIDENTYQTSFGKKFKK